jgi:UDP-galactose transporter B1
MVSAKLVVTLTLMMLGFCTHFYLQEGLIPKRRTSSDLPYPDVLQLFCNFSNVIFAIIIIAIRKLPWRQSPFPFIAVSIPQRLGATCQQFAQRHVDYPALQLFKSAKPIAVLAAQLLSRQKVADCKPIVVVVILSIGFAVFGFAGRLQSFSAWGTLLASGALFFDAIYVPIVDVVKKRGGPVIVMLYAQMWSFLIFGVLNGHQTIKAIRWIAAHPAILRKIAPYAVAGSFGQAALFFALGMTDGLVIAIATTCRKFCTILLSAIFYRHTLKKLQWIGVGIVFFGLLLDNVWEDRRRARKKSEEKVKEDEKEKAERKRLS